MALLLNVPRTATVAATSEVTLVVMHDRNFRAMEEEIPAIAKRVNAIMQERRAKSAEQGIET
jgi:CRP-like cAMP-binding protein